MLNVYSVKRTTNDCINMTCDLQTILAKMHFNLVIVLFFAFLFEASLQMYFLRQKGTYSNHSLCGVQVGRMGCVPAYGGN